MADIVFSIFEPDAAATARRFDTVPSGCGWIEIRADRLRADDLPGLIARAPRRCIVTVRRAAEGGGYEGPEEARIAMLRAALAAGASVDVEWGSAAAVLADETDPERVILSHHGGVCRIPEMEATYRAMAASRAARLKIVDSIRHRFLNELGVQDVEGRSVFDD